MNPNNVQPTGTPQLIPTTQPVMPQQFNQPQPKKSPKTLKVVAIICASLIMLGFGVFTLLSYKDNSYLATLPHTLRAQKINTIDYEGLETFVSPSLSTTGRDFNITYDEYMKLPEERRNTRVMSLDDKTVNTTFFLNEVKKGTCTQVDRMVTCYDSKSERDALFDTMLAAAGSSDIITSKSSYKLKNFEILRDAVTGLSYGNNLAAASISSTTTHDSSYAFEYDQTTNTARSLTVGSEFPTSSEVFGRTTSNLLVQLNYFDPGVRSVVKLDFQVVNGQFYAVYGSPLDSNALNDSDKGIYHYDKATQKWVHLTPDVNYTNVNAPSNSGVIGDYIISKDGCTLGYTIVEQAYTLKACEL